MAWVAADLTAIEDAIASGALRVAYQDKIVTYRNIGELQRARNIVKQDIDNAGSTTTKARQVRMETSSGW